MNYRTIFGDPTDDAVEVKMLFIGAGSAFCVNPLGKNWQSNVLMDVTNDKGETRTLLIDCGGDARHAAAETGRNVAKVDAIFVSHLHADHVTGLEQIALVRKFPPGQSKPHIVGNTRTLRNLWDQSLQGGLRTLEGQHVSLETYFESHYIEDNGGIIFNGLKIELVNVVHIMDDHHIQPSHALLLHMPNGQVVFFTTDTQHSPKQISHFYAQADVVFHDCETMYDGIWMGEPDLAKPIMSGVHAHLEELGTLPAELRAKMHLYHYQDGTLDQNRVVPEGKMSPIEARGHELGFRGFVRKGNLYTWDQKKTNA